MKYTDGEQDIFLTTRKGQCIRFHETDVRCSGRSAMGVTGIRLVGTDEVIGVQTEEEGEYILFVSEKGLGKCTKTDEFSPQNRGGKGVRCYKIVDKTGELAGVKAVSRDDEIMMITTEGILIRMRVADISVIGRSTSGVKLINMQDGVTVASIAKVQEENPLPPEDGEETSEMADGNEADREDSATSDEASADAK